MRTLLERALDKYAQAEVYKIKNKATSLHYQTGRLQNIENEIHSAITLRVLNEGRSGFSYTRNMQDADNLLRNADISFMGNVKAGYEFPHSPLVEKLDSYRSEIEEQTIELLSEECVHLGRVLQENTDAEVEIYMGKNVIDLELINSKSTDLFHKSSSYNMMAVLIYPGSGWGIEYQIYDKLYRPFDNNDLGAVIERYNRSKKIVKPAGGQMQVLFMPSTLYTLTWRLASGTSSRSYYHKITPIADKEEMRLFDPKLTIYTDPLDEEHPECRPFDDEGVVCHRHILVKNGVFKKRYNDLNYAAKLNERHTGHGWKQGTTSQPEAGLRYLRITPGHDSLQSMIENMDRGIILEGVLGAHSGNIPNGDFSVGVSPALYVENGKIVGRVKDAMISGNIYTLLKKVEAVEDTVHPAQGNWLPAILINGVNVAM